MISFTPNDWEYQNEPFDLIIQAQDDNQVFCQNFKCSYEIITNETFTKTATTIQGFIIIPIKEKCVICLTIEYPKDSTLPMSPSNSNHYTIQHEIDLPYPTGIKGVFINTEYEVSDVIDINTIRMYYLYNRGEPKLISNIDVLFSNTMAIKEGAHYVVCKYKSFECTILININRKLIGIRCTYKGTDQVEDGQMIYNSDVYVSSLWLVNYITNETKSQELSDNEWSFETFPIISKDNDGILVIKYKDKIGDLNVPFKNKSKSYLQTYWDGGILEPGETYNPEHVSIIMHYDEYHQKVLKPSQCSFSSFLIKNGANIFTVTYSGEERIYRNRFLIYGEYKIVYEDLELKVMWFPIHKDPIDITNDFKLRFHNIDIDKTVISWSGFAAVCIENNYHGNFELTAPATTGLFYQYPTKWTVWFNRQTESIKASLKHIHVKEVNYEEE